MLGNIVKFYAKEGDTTTMYFIMIWCHIMIRERLEDVTCHNNIK